MGDRKVAVVTGASSGIGAALAFQMSQQGISVVLAARREEKLHEMVSRIRDAGGTARAVVCDVTVRDAAERLVHGTVDEFGQLDILVNNAGRGHFASVEETTDEIIRNMFEVNVFALWYTIRPALKYMRARGIGHIVNIASMAGKLGYPYNSAYVAAKHACVGFTHALRMELVDTGIHATVVCPAGVLTEWASVTEGGPMLPFFSESGPIIKRIMAERGTGLVPIEGVLPAETVAAKIMECIEKPVAECYTHRGAKEFAALAASDRERAEQYQVPVALGEREVYEQHKRKKD